MVRIAARASVAFRAAGACAWAACAVIAAAPSHAAPSAAPARPLAFIGVTVVPMDRERELPDETVLVQDGRIAAVGPRADVAVPRGAARIDGRRLYLLPALADMHAHLSEYVTDTREDKRAVVRAELLLYLATGVTLVRNMAGSPDHLDLRARVAAGEITGPRIFTTTPIIDGANPVWPFAVKLTEASQAGALVEGFVSQGYDQVKVYNGLTLEAYAALMDAAAKRGIRVVGHVPLSVGIGGALAAGQYSIEHQRGYDFDGVRPQALILNGGRNAERFGSWQHMSDERMRELVAKTVAAGTWNCPTFVVDDMMSDREKRAALLGQDLVRYLRPETRAEIVSNELDAMFPAEASAALRASFPVRYRMLKLLSDAGAGLLVGTDSMVPYLLPGFTPIDEMQHFVSAGLSPFAALRAATSAPARFMGIDAEAGTIAVGKRADLLLLEADPLRDIANLWRQRGVVLAGRWLPRNEIRRMLEELAATYPPSKEKPSPP